MIFLPHKNTVILLEPYCGTITEPGLPVLIYPRLNTHCIRILHTWLGCFSFLHYFTFDRITSILMMFCSLGHFVMAIIRTVHLIRVRSRIYRNKPLIKPPTPHPHQLLTHQPVNKKVHPITIPTHPPKCIEMNSIYYDLLTLS